MSTTPHAPAALDVAPQYARVNRRAALRTRRVWIGLAVVGFLGVSGYALARNGLLPRWWGAAVGGPGAFTVRPLDLPIVLSEDGELKPVQSTEIRNEVEGQATIVFIIPESSKVKKGDLLIELASDDLKERLEKEQIDLRSTQAAYAAAVQELAITLNENASKLKKAEIDKAVAELELRQYIDGDYQKARKAAEIDIIQTRMDIDRKLEEIQKSQRLLDRKFITQAKMDQLKFELEKAQMTLEKNELALQILETYEKPKNETQKSSAVEQATQELEREQKRAESRAAQAQAKLDEQKALLALRESRVRRFEEQLTKCKIFAPSDGVVQYPNPEGNWRGGGEPLAVGKQVMENELLLVLPNTTQMLVATRVHEADRHLVVEGLPCEVRVPAVPGRVFSGKVAKVARFADSANRWLNPNLKEHAAEVLLDEFDAALSPGDSAEVKILVDTVSNVLAVPVQSVFTRGPRHFVFVRNALKPQPVEVKLGRSNTQMIEVASGLKAGDVVLMHADEPMLAMLPSGLPAPDEKPEAAPAQPRPQRREGGGGERRGRGNRGSGRADRGGDSTAVASTATNPSQPTVDGAAKLADHATPDATKPEESRADGAAADDAAKLAKPAAAGPSKPADAAGPARPAPAREP